MKPDTLILAKYTRPNAGYRDPARLLKRLLKTGQYYEVEEVSMERSSTSIKLRYFSIAFNSVHFDFFDEEETPIDIYTRKDVNQYFIDSIAIRSE